MDIVPQLGCLIGSKVRLKFERQMAKFPPEVKAFHDAMLRIPGVVDVTTGLKDLSEFTPDTYTLPGDFGDLPHALAASNQRRLRE